jgi:hypothetical protein
MAPAANPELEAARGNLREVARLLYGAFAELLVAIERLEHEENLERPEYGRECAKTARKLSENGPEPATDPRP